jgi:hypothetical protein
MEGKNLKNKEKKSRVGRIVREEGEWRLPYQGRYTEDRVACPYQKAVTRANFCRP